MIIKNEGLPVIRRKKNPANNSPNGDHIVTFKVQIPDEGELTQSQKQAIHHYKQVEAKVSN